MRPLFAAYIGPRGAASGNPYFNIACRMGYEAQAHVIRDHYISGRRSEAVAAVPDALVDEVALVGPLDAIVDRIEAWRGTGWARSSRSRRTSSSSKPSRPPPNKPLQAAAHLSNMNTYEEDPNQQFHFIETLLGAERLTSADNNHQEIIINLANKASQMFVSVRIRIDTEVPPGLYDDFVVTRLLNKSQNFTFVASLGFRV